MPHSYGMALPTSTDVGQPVTDITDECLVTAEPIRTSTNTGQHVTYVPANGGADDR